MTTLRILTIRRTEINQHRPTRRNWLKRLFHNAPCNRTELLQVLREAKKANIIDNDVCKMMEGSLSVANQQVRDIMVPRTQVVSITQDKTPDEFLPIVLEAAHSRFPIFNTHNTEVIGVLITKDLLQYQIKHHNEPFDVTKIMRPALFVPESKRLDTLLREFRQSHNHLAIVVDEYGSVSGIITIEDVLEEIVGDIEDEFDTAEKPPITAIKHNRYAVDALTEIEEFNEYFHAELPHSKIDTIGGLVTQRLGRLPKKGDTVHIDTYQFTVTETNERRVIQLEIAPLTVRK